MKTLAFIFPFLFLFLSGCSDIEEQDSPEKMKTLNKAVALYTPMLDYMSSTSSRTRHLRIDSFDNLCIEHGAFRGEDYEETTCFDVSEFKNNHPVDYSGLVSNHFIVSQFEYRKRDEVWEVYIPHDIRSAIELEMASELVLKSLNLMQTASGFVLADVEKNLASWD